MSEHGDVGGDAEAWRADAWRAFEHKLSRFLAGMRDGEALILSDATDDSRYVQFLSFGSEGTNAEVSTGTADAEVKRLGWQPPRKNWRGKPAGSPNFTTVAPSHEVHLLSALAVRVLGHVWQIDAPCALTADKVVDSGGPPVSDLGLPTKP